MPQAALIPLATAAISTGGALLAGRSQKKAADTAADAQTRVAEQNNALTREIYQRNTENFTPYMETGRNAMGSLNSLIAGDQGAFDQFRQGTNYNFRLNEGLRALDSRYAAMGARESGAAMKGITRYAGDLASGELGNYTDLLRGQQQLGFGGASALAGVGQQFGETTSRNNQNAADATSNAALLRGQASSSMYGGIASGVGNALGSLNFGSSYAKPVVPNSLNAPWFVGGGFMPGLGGRYTPGIGGG